MSPNDPTRRFPWSPPDAAPPAADAPEPKAEVDLEPQDVPASAGGLTVRDLVSHSHEDHVTGREVIVFGFVVEVMDAFTDERSQTDAPERARVAWLGGGLSGPIDSTDLIPV